MDATFLWKFKSENWSRLVVSDSATPWAVCSLPGSSVHAIFQAIVLEWIAISFSRGSSQPRDRTQVSRIVDRRFTVWATREVYERSKVLSKYYYCCLVAKVCDSLGTPWTVACQAPLSMASPRQEYWSELAFPSPGDLPVSGIKAASPAFSSVCHSVVSDSLRPHGLQHARLPCPSPTPRLAQTHVHRVGDAIQPSLPLSSPSSPAFNLSQHQGPFQWVSSSHQVAKVLELQLQHQSFQWILRNDFLYYGLVGSPCSPRDSQESSPACRWILYHWAMGETPADIKAY